MVAAFARDPMRVDIKHANLRVAQGDVMDPASLERAIQGQEAVLCSLGAGRKGRVRSEGTRNIISAMEKVVHLWLASDVLSANRLLEPEIVGAI